MERLKEYAGVIAAAVTVFASLAALGLWAINAQVTPEINRLDGRIDNFQSLYTQIIGRLDRMERRFVGGFDRIDGRFKQIDDRFQTIDDRFQKVDDRFQKMDDRFQKIDERFQKVDDRFQKVDDRFGQMDVRFVHLESRMNRRFDDMAATMNAILAKFPAPSGQGNQ